MTPHEVTLHDLKNLTISSPVRTWTATDASGFQTIAISSDGRRLALGDSRGTIRQWDLGSGREGAKIEMSVRLTAMTYSPDGKYLAVGLGGYVLKDGEMVRTADGQWVMSESGVDLVNAQTGKREHLFAGGSWPVEIAFSGNGTFLLSSSQKQPLLVWDVKKRQPLANFKAPALAGAVRLAPLNNHEVLLGTLDGRILLWDLATSTERKTFRGSASWITALAVLPGGKQVASLHLPTGRPFRDREMRLSSLHVWDIARGVEVGQTTIPTFPASLAAFPDGLHLLTTEQDGAVRLLDVRKFNQPTPPEKPKVVVQPGKTVSEHKNPAAHLVLPATA
jgi:WD40 repeat protein